MAFFTKVCDKNVFTFTRQIGSRTSNYNNLGVIYFVQGDHVWISLKDVKDFDVPIGAVVKSVDGLGMLLIDDQGEVCLQQLRHKFSANHNYNKYSNLIRYQQALFVNLLDSLSVVPLFLGNTRH